MPAAPAPGGCLDNDLDLVVRLVAAPLAVARSRPPPLSDTYFFTAHALGHRPPGDGSRAHVGGRACSVASDAAAATAGRGGWPSLASLTVAVGRCL